MSEVKPYQKLRRKARKKLEKRQKKRQERGDAPLPEGEWRPKPVDVRDTTQNDVRRHAIETKTNESLQECYDGLSPWLPADDVDERDRFWSSVRTPLPSTFRLTDCAENATMRRLVDKCYVAKVTQKKDVKMMVVDDVDDDKPTEQNSVEETINDDVADEVKVEKIRWLENSNLHAYQISMDRKSIRREPTLQRLHEMLVSESEAGFMTRQELVSMIPPALMDCAPGQRVLDMCAAPGSKTCQIVEALNPTGVDDDKLCKSIVVANDADHKRCYLMIHQLKRLHSPNIIVTNNDAAAFPLLRDGDGQPILFDRVLADVPCSGDGTLRKNKDLWCRWTPNSAPALHSVQRRILRRGLELLAPGGRLVYSTCSMNPIENEAVVGSILADIRDSLNNNDDANKLSDVIELIDCSLKVDDKIETLDDESSYKVCRQLPGMRYRPGMTKWRIMSKDRTWYDSFEDIPIDAPVRSQLTSTMFPLKSSGSGGDCSDEFNLHRCLRLLPHLQDTGGFFVAVFEKKMMLPTQKSKKWTGVSNNTDVSPNNSSNSIPLKKLKQSSATGEDGDEGVNGAVAVDAAAENNDEDEEEEEEEKVVVMKGKRPPPTEEPFVFVRPDELPFWHKIVKFYDVDTNFPDRHRFSLMIRGKPDVISNRQIVSLMTSSIRSLLTKTGACHPIYMGLRLFARTTSPLVHDCDYRPDQEGVRILERFAGDRRKVLLPRADLLTVLRFDNPLFSRLTAPTRRRLESLSPGGVIFVHEAAEVDKNEVEPFTDDVEAEFRTEPLTMSEDDEEQEEGGGKKKMKALPGCRLVLSGWRGKMSTRVFIAKYQRSHFLRLCGLHSLDRQGKFDSSNKNNNDAKE